MMNKLEVDSVLLEYGSRRILSDVYLKCETGKVSGLLGRNGNGKTSLMNIIFGSLIPNSKSVRFNEVSVPKAYATPGLLAYLPQFNFIPASLTLKRVFTDFDLDYSTFEKHFPEFKSKYQSRVSGLSGGQRRLLELYVVMKSKSKFLLLDEPFSHLSPLMIGVIREHLEEEKKNKGILITDHLYRHVIDAADDLYVLADENVHLVKQMADIERLGYAHLDH
ncbi:ABC transporter ATP-binding protein [Pedobacter sp. KBW06]|uniref:ATP-binding cassette domain-containing protein n=1 Tax=Pedobacter sp. KBW06 TaxID=2153359 RepID=UPI000F593657|nr:ATP-binding cassette domain-containing protein [Pedobacter sp. KBW06]RQO69916.1 ABC transporter ATP-binding protein [Pedobacter sp. KBW06]